MSAFPKVYTVDEVAAVLEVAPHTVYRLLCRGKLVGFKVGSAWRVTHSEVLAFMTRPAVPVAPDVPEPEVPPPPGQMERLLPPPSQRRFSQPRSA